MIHRPLLLPAAALCMAAGAHAEPSASRLAQIDAIVARYEATLHLPHGAARCVVIDDLGILFHPSTSPETVRQTLKRLPEPAVQSYRATSDWTRTATDSFVGGRSPFTITYSFVADGTPITPALEGESSGPSNLFAQLTPRFGGNFENWKNVFRSAIVAWGQYTPITYREVADDGARMPNNAGSSARGDVRIGMHSIDGPLGVLAYNYFPNNGDMIMDADDADFFAEPAQNYLQLFNTVAHEHGHGLGFSHVIPTNQTKLMEPVISTLFEGLQEDDIRGAMFTYGDFNESNNSFATRTYVGSIPAPSGGTPGFGVLPLSAIEDISEVDFYSFTVPVNGSLTVTAFPLGTSYREGPQSGTDSLINARAMQDLALELRNSGNAVLASADAFGAGSSETINGVLLTAGDYVVVTRSVGGTSGQSQLYELRFSLAAADVPDVPEKLEFSFESSPEGWTFAGFPPLGPGSGTHTPGSDPGGTLNIRSAGTGSFGFWESPWIEVLDPGQSPTSGGLAIRRSSTNFLGRPFWKMKATVASDAVSGSTAPTLRIRTLARDVSEADVFSAEPVGTADNSPRAGSDRDYTFYFETSPHNPGFRVAMDLLNAPGLASTTANLRLRKLEIESEDSDVSPPIVAHSAWTFDGGSDGWQFLTPSPSEFTLPTGSVAPGALRIQPRPFTAGQPTQQFGWWNGPEVGATMLLPNRLYWAEFTVRSTSSDPNVVPSFRMRLNELGFQSAALKQISSNFLGSGPSATPPTTTPRVYRVFFPPNTANGRGMFPSFDLLTVQVEGDSTAVGLFLDEVRIFSVNTSAFD